MDIPEPLFKNTVTDLQKVAVRDNPVALESFKSPPSLFTLVMIFTGLSIGAYIIAEISNYLEIKRNWTQYQCMPSIAPFATFYGHNLAETMNFCMSQAVREHAGAVIDPIYAEINQVTGVVEGVYNQMEELTEGVSGLLAGLDKFVMEFMNSFRLIGVRVRMTFIKMKAILDRVYGIFMAFSFAAISAVTFGDNLACNPLVTFMGEITGTDVCCFASDTPVLTDDQGGCKPISKLALGDSIKGYTGSVVLGDSIKDDSIKGTNEVTALFEFDGTNTKMVQIQGVHVSANHFVDSRNGLVGMVHADKHPDAKSAPSLSRIYCVSTSQHIMYIPTESGAGLRVADYEEDSDLATQAEAQRIAETTLNHNFGSVVPGYSLGFGPSLYVQLANTAWVRIVDVHIGDILAGGGRVTGTVSEKIAAHCLRSHRHHLLGDAQLVFEPNTGWQRAKYLFSENEVTSTTTTLHHLFVTTHEFTVGDPTIGLEFRVRDYAEIDGTEIQSPYDKKLIGL